MSEYDDAVVDIGSARQRLRAPPLSDGGLAAPSPPAVAGSPYDQAADILLAGRRQSAMGSVIGAQGSNPDAAGKAMTLSRQVGAPAGVVEGDLPGFEAKARLDRSGAIIARNPSLTDYLAQDPMHARVSQDDFDHLDGLTKTWRSFADGWSQALQGNERGRLGNEAMLGTDTSLQVQKVDRELAQHPVLSGLYGALQTIGGFTGGMTDNFLHGGVQAAQGMTVGAAAGGIATAPAGGVGAIPGAAVGTVVGFGVGWKYDMSRVAAGNTYLNLSQARGVNGEEISPVAKDAASVLVGLGTFALAGIGEKAVGKAGAEAASKLLSDAMTQAVTRPTVQRALVNFAGALTKAGIKGAALNTAMTGTSIFGEELAKTVSAGNFETVFNDPVKRQEAVDQLITAATDGAMLFPLMHLPFAAGSLVGDTMRAHQAAADVAGFQQVETGAVDSKTRARSLGAFQSFMQQQTQGHPTEHIGVTGEAIRTLYQSAGVEPGPGDGLLGDVVPDIGRQMEQATATGGDIIVPTAAYVAHLAGTPISEALRADIRFRPDGMTLREAHEYEAARGEHLADLATQGRAGVDAAMATDEPVRQVQADILGKLRAAGITADAAQQYAALVASRYEARAASFEGKLGTAMDLYRSEGLDVRRETPETLRHVPTDESDLVINALRDTDRKEPSKKELFGPTLHEAVKAAGGVVDTGGELRSMDLHLAKTKGLIRKSKGDLTDDARHSVDDISLQMWEAGYFPELTERPSPDEFYAAMRGGDKLYSEGANNERKAAFEAAVKDLDEFLNRRGIDVKKASNATIKEAIAEGLKEDEQHAGREFSQQMLAANDTLQTAANSNEPDVVQTEYHKMLKVMENWLEQEKDRTGQLAPGLIKQMQDFHDWLESLGPVTIANHIDELNSRLADWLDASAKYKYSDGSNIRSLFQGNRGRISVESGKSIITLFKGSDLSTFLHETGHQWLEELSRDAVHGEAPAALKADAETIAKWLGATDLTNLTTEQHEQFARGFERYLMEGKAPSGALASAFRKFKSWLVRIYRDVAALRVPMSDEIRGVFDRMVASEDAITHWRQAESLNPVFASAKDAGMTEAEFSAYTKAVAKARNAADEKMIARSMEAVRKQRTKEWKDEAAGVREEVAPMVRSRPDLKAQYFLRTGKLLDDPEAPAGERVRLSRKALDEMFGTDEASKALPSGIISAEGGAHPDEVGDLFGYRSGDEMVRALMSLESSRKQAEEATGEKLDGQAYVRKLIDDQVRDTMLERHGDALNDGSIEEEALAAVHNAAQADVMAMEMRAIARDAGATALRRADIEHWATGQLDEMPVERATDQRAFARAEAKAGRDAERALLKGNKQAAFEAKQRQLINHILATKAGEAAEQYGKGRETLRKLGKTPKREAIQQSFMDQIHGIIERLGMATKRSEADMMATPALRDFANSQAGMEIGQDFFVPDFLLNERWSVPDTDKMPMGQFFEAMEAVKSLENLGRKMREMEVDGDKIRFSDIIDEMRTQLGDAAGTGAEGVTSKVSNMARLKEGLLGSRAAMRRVESWARLADGGNANGPFTRYIVRPMFEALDRYRPEKTRRLQQLWDIIEPRRKELNGAKITMPEINYTFENKGELLHAILHTGNESNLRKLLLGREWGEMDKDGNLDRSRWDAGVQRLEDARWIKQEDYETAQAIWDLLEELKPAAQDAHKDIYGVRFDEVTAQAFQTPWGEYRGGYMPAVVDRYIVRDGQERSDADALKEQQTGAMFPSTGRGFTKSRVENYTKPLELNLSRIPSHIDSVLRFTHLQPTVRDLGRLMLKRGFKDLMHDTDPTVISDLFTPWVKRTATQTLNTPADGPAGRFWAKILNNLRRRSSMQILAFNISNSLQQLVGISPSILRTSKGAMMRSLMIYIRQPGKVADEIAGKSPYMAERMSNKTQDLMLEIEGAIHADTPLSNAQNWGQRHGSILQHMFQNIVDITTWKAAYEHGANDGMTEADTIAHANEVVRSTQGGYTPEELSKFETGSALQKLLVSHFYTYWGSQANMLATEFGLTKGAGTLGAKSRHAAITFYGIIVPAVLSDLIYRGVSGSSFGGDDEDGDEPTMMGMAMYFLGTTGRYLSGMVPVIGPGIVALTDKSAGDRFGSSPTVSVGKKMLRVPHEVSSAMEGTGGYGPVVRDSMTALGMILHLPLGQVGKAAGYGVDVATGHQTPENARDVLRGLTTGSQKEYH